MTFADTSQLKAPYFSVNLSQATSLIEQQFKFRRVQEKRLIAMEMGTSEAAPSGEIPTEEEIDNLQ